MSSSSFLTLSIPSLNVFNPLSTTIEGIIDWASFLTVKNVLMSRRLMTKFLSQCDGISYGTAPLTHPEYTYNGTLLFYCSYCSRIPIKDGKSKLSLQTGVSGITLNGIMFHFDKSKLHEKALQLYKVDDSSRKRKKIIEDSDDDSIDSVSTRNLVLEPETKPISEEKSKEETLPKHSKKQMIVVDSDDELIESKSIESNNGEIDLDFIEVDDEPMREIEDIPFEKDLFYTVKNLCQNPKILNLFKEKCPTLVKGSISKTNDVRSYHPYIFFCCICSDRSILPFVGFEKPNSFESGTPYISLDTIRAHVESSAHLEHETMCMRSWSVNEQMKYKIGPYRLRDDQWSIPSTAKDHTPPIIPTISTSPSQLPPILPTCSTSTVEIMEDVPQSSGSSSSPQVMLEKKDPITNPVSSLE